MDDINNDNNNNELWNWPEEFSLSRDPGNDISQYLWDGVNQNEDKLLQMLDDQTPIKDCADFGYHISDIGDNSNKELEECRDSSQLKRRRMLQFSSNTNEIDTADEQITSHFLKSKAREGSLEGDELSEHLQWDSWNLELPDDRPASGFEGFNQSSYGWMPPYLNERDVHYNPDEINVHVTSDDQVDAVEFYNIPPEVEGDVVQETPPPAPLKIIRGRSSFIKTPRKLITSVAYPFALIKPCGDQGGVTLKDINQRIHAPSQSKSKNMMNSNNPSLVYPTSAFSGKPVVVKTKINTGGKGSITIMRTKG